MSSSSSAFICAACRFGPSKPTCSAVECHCSHGAAPPQARERNSGAAAPARRDLAPKHRWQPLPMSRDRFLLGQKANRDTNARVASIGIVHG